MLHHIKFFSFVALPLAAGVYLGGPELPSISSELSMANTAPWSNFDSNAGEGVLKDVQSIAKIISLRTLGELPRRDVNLMAGHILRLSRQYGFPPAFILSLIDVESRFRTDAVSNRGAMGLMQLKPGTAKAIADKLDLPWEGEKSLRDPRKNLEVALHYLQELREKYKKPRYYLVAYSQGPERLNQIIRSGQPLPHEYYNKVMKSYRSYHSGAY